MTETKPHSLHRLDKASMNGMEGWREKQKWKTWEGKRVTQQRSGPDVHWMDTEASQQEVLNALLSREFACFPSVWFVTLNRLTDAWNMLRWEQWDTEDNRGEEVDTFHENEGQKNQKTLWPSLHSSGSNHLNEAVREGKKRKCLFHPITAPSLLSM